MDSDNAKSIDYKQTEEMVDYFLDNGFTYFDTAYPYHEEMSEDAVNRCLVRGIREINLFLQTRMPIMRVKSQSDYQMFFEEQLRRMRC